MNREDPFCVIQSFLCIEKCLAPIGRVIVFQKVDKTISGLKIKKEVVLV